MNIKFNSKLPAKPKKIEILFSFLKCIMIFLCDFFDIFPCDGQLRAQSPVIQSHTCYERCCKGIW